MTFKEFVLRPIGERNISISLAACLYTIPIGVILGLAVIRNAPLVLCALFFLGSLYFVYHTARHSCNRFYHRHMRDRLIAHGFREDSEWHALLASLVIILLNLLFLFLLSIPLIIFF